MALKMLIEKFGLHKVDESINLENRAMVYLAAQGEDIITIGSSKGRTRLRSLMGKSGVHNKKPLISLGNKIRSEIPIQFYFLYADTKASAEALERQMQNVLGAYFQVGSESTMVGGHLGYQAALDYLVAQLPQNLILTERHRDLIEMVRIDGDILDHALNSPRLRQIAIDIFGDLYAKPAKGTVTPLPSRQSRRRIVGAENRVTSAHATGFVQTFYSQFTFTLPDYERVVDKNAPGIEIHISGEGALWEAGPLMLVIPRHPSEPGWRYLEELTQKNTFRENGGYFNSKNVPVPLRPYKRRLAG